MATPSARNILQKKIPTNMYVRLVSVTERTRTAAETGAVLRPDAQQQLLDFHRTGEKKKIHRKSSRTQLELSFAMRPPFNKPEPLIGASQQCSNKCSVSPEDHEDTSLKEA